MRTSGLLLLVALSGCSTTAPIPPGPTPLTGSSQTLTVRGQYAPVAIDHVDRLSVEGANLVLHGASSSVAVPLPPGAGQPRPAGEQWALVTEARADRKRTVTFTHEKSLDDFTLDLPGSDAELRYGTLAAAAGGDDFVVFAWGNDSRSGWGYVTIARAAPGAHP
jgi:hypothetical protein